MHILLIFLDGVGLGADDPASNPFVAADYPSLKTMTNGQKWTIHTGHQQTERAAFIPTDATLGVAGRPQSGTGQAAIVTGQNIPQMIGQHYGPKPDAITRTIIKCGNIFQHVVSSGKSAALLEAYPPAWHHVIGSGKRLPSSYQLAAQSAGVAFFGESDFRAGRALSGDFTGAGWHSELGYEDTPIISAYQAGVRMVELSRRYDFAFFPHWLTDVVGHRGQLADAVRLLKTFDEVLRGVLDTWHDDEGLVIVTSDHGNIEDMSHRSHTENPVPTVVIGAERERFSGVKTLADIAPIIRRILC